MFVYLAQDDLVACLTDKLKQIKVFYLPFSLRQLVVISVKLSSLLHQHD